MNKILVTNDEVTLLEADEKLKVTLSDKFDLFDIVKLKIECLEDTQLEVIHKNKKESKIDIVIEVNENVNLSIFEIKDEKNIKVQYRYYLNKNSNLLVHKFYDCDIVKELDIVNLNGENATINYNLKTISKDKQKFDVVVYHNYSNTISNINHNGVNIKDGSLNFNLTGIVYNKIINCELEQASRIITFNNNKCNINPNLLIEENDVIANHSALIGKINEEELFYLMSRGINKVDALNLIIKGFLLEGIDEKEKVSEFIDRYWR